MKQVTTSGKTVEEAVQSALDRLQTSKEHVQVDVIDEGKKGFFGIFGATRAIVKAVLLPKASELNAQVEVETDTEAEETKRDQEISKRLKRLEKLEMDEEVNTAENYIISVAKQMDIEVAVKVTIKSRNVYFSLESENIALLIGKRGQTLNALQTLVQLMLNQQRKRYYNVVLDAEDYRARRSETLASLAERMALRALSIRKKVALEPMPSFERKIIHRVLEKRHDIITKSEGKEPYRHIVIQPKD